MAKKKLRVKRQKIRQSRRDWDEAERLADELIGVIYNDDADIVLRKIEDVLLPEPTEE